MRTALYCTVQTELSTGVKAPDIDVFGLVCASNCPVEAGPHVAERLLAVEFHTTRRQRKV